jgi:Tfp pilus assembly protein PilP
MTSMTRLSLVALLVVSPVAAAAQSPKPQAPAAPASQPAATAATPSSSAAAVPGQVPVIAVEPRGFEYDPAGRRDPFVSLVRRGTDVGRPAPGARAAGLPGLEAAEVTLKGTLQSRDGYVAMLQGADGRTYIVRPGDRLLDGTIRTIAQNTLVILQQVNDPLSLEKQREVRKTIRQTDEAINGPSRP